MRKSQAVAMLARHLGVRATRLTSLTQRLAEAGMLPVASGPPYPDLTPAEIARMLLVAVTDEGLGAAPRTAERYGSLLSGKVTLEAVLAHALQRPESVPASHSSLKIHTGDHPSAVLTTASPDGSLAQVFSDRRRQDNVERVVVVSGSALHEIARELSGKSAQAVDALLQEEK